MEPKAAAVPLDPEGAAAPSPPKAAAAPPQRRAAAGPARRAAPQSAAQRAEAEEKESLKKEEEPEDTKYDGIRGLLIKYKEFVEVKDRRWRIGRIYTCLGAVDLFARVSVLGLFQAQFGALRIASVSDTQALDYTSYGRPADIENLALLRLTVSASAGITRSIVSCFLLWKVFPRLRPSWHGKPHKRRPGSKGPCRLDMVPFTYLFRTLLLLWCLCDLIQVCVPEDSTKYSVTPHRVFKMTSETGFFFAHLILLKTLRYDREALIPFVYAGYFVMVMIVGTGLWLDFRVAGSTWEKTRTLWASVQWTFLVELETIIMFVGFAMPDSLTLSMGFVVERSGKALPGEDDSFFVRRPKENSSDGPLSAGASAQPSSMEDPDQAPLRTDDYQRDGSFDSRESFFGAPPTQRRSGPTAASSSSSAAALPDELLDF